MSTDTDTEYIREAIELAREAVADGNTPYGSLLVVDDTVVKRSRNTTVTENDVTAHPELKLARWAARELDAADREDCTMYTSTEPCEMCATAIYYAGLDRVVYSVSGESVANVRGKAKSGISFEEVIDRKGGSTDVDGPILETEGKRVHEEFY
ncbi:nucleoside deaminase [Halopiger aswanensis]|uniref:tRNA(Arg) A34 adenosine deaminase TadA n=1 Tax=Halopiger aswanensis TaxID=148449 RepID=A0A3R7DDB9_9EURY|nr:nucleoside deaminase [Halopiger aswanensis]RKD95354.1 tRNA(Arg) A34 adenosine deaminase TadA [Halopiger aswanensis]